MAQFTIFRTFPKSLLSKFGANSIDNVQKTVKLVLFSRWTPNCADHKDQTARNPGKMPGADKNVTLKFSKANPDAFPPTKGSVKAAGFDLKSVDDVVVPAKGKALVDTGLIIELPEGCYGRIAPRSGLAAKHFIDVGAGVIDEDYRGLVKVVLFNHSDENFEVKKGDRIAQLVCEKIFYPELQEINEVSGTARGEGGFGSTGTN